MHSKTIRGKAMSIQNETSVSGLQPFLPVVWCSYSLLAAPVAPAEAYRHTVKEENRCKVSDVGISRFRFAMTHFILTIVSLRGIMYKMQFCTQTCVLHCTYIVADGKAKVFATVLPQNCRQFSTTYERRPAV